MPLSQTAQDELRAELAAIDTLRKQMNQRLDARATAIKAVLEPFDFSQTTLPFQSRVGEGLRIGDDVRATITAPLVVTRSKFASTGLRESILDVLKSHGPMRAPSVAKILATTGFKNDSKTKLPIRVYNDLWRMKEAGMVENKDGVFSLKEVA